MISRGELQNRATKVKMLKTVSKFNMVSRGYNSRKLVTPRFCQKYF
jgi:hypothetical protein